MNVHIQVFHLAWEECRLAALRADVRISLAGRAGIVHQVAVHPVVFTTAHDGLDALSVRPAQPRRAAFAAATGQCSYYAVVIGSRHQGRLSVAGMTLDRNLVRIGAGRVGIICKFIDGPADAPGPGHERAWIRWLPPISAIDQTD